MLEDLMEEFGWVLVILLILGGLAALIYVIVKEDKKADAHRAQVCAEAMAMARTSADSITVKLRCDLPEETETTVVPMPIVIPAR